MTNDNSQTLSLEQKIAQKEAELARLKEKKEKVANGQKVVLGGMVLSVARKNKDFANQLINMINSEVNRDTDKKRLASIVDELQQVINAKSVITESEQSMVEQYGLNHG